MTDHVYSVSEIVGSAPGTIDDAIRNALERAGKTLRHLEWFEMTQVRGQLNEDGSIAYYQVMLKVGFRLGAESHLAGGRRQVDDPQELQLRGVDRERAAQQRGGDDVAAVGGQLERPVGRGRARGQDAAGRGSTCSIVLP